MRALFHKSLLSYGRQERCLTLIWCWRNKGRSFYKGEIYYLVKWKLYKTTTWEPVDNILEGCFHLIKQFERRERAREENAKLTKSEDNISFNEPMEQQPDQRTLTTRIIKVEEPGEEAEITNPVSRPQQIWHCGMDGCRDLMSSKKEVREHQWIKHQRPPPIRGQHKASIDCKVEQIW